MERLARTMAIAGGVVLTALVILVLRQRDWAAG
jgi:hypothetical protein